MNKKKQNFNKQSVDSGGWGFLSLPWKGIATSIVAIGGLLVGYLSSLPAIDYESLVLDQPLQPEYPIVVKGTLKNFGSTTASKYSIAIILGSCLCEKPPQPDFSSEVDAFGQRRNLTIHDLPPGQEDHIIPGGRPWTLDQSAYGQFVSGKRTIYLYSHVQYRDILQIPHSLDACYKISGTSPGPLSRCSERDQ